MTAPSPFFTWRARTRASFSLMLSLSLLALLAACSRPKESLGQKKPAGAPVPVTVAVAQRKDVPIQLAAIGTVRPLSTVSVKSRVDGQLAKVGFKEGDEVKQGERIFTIDPLPFEAALRQAEAVVARDTASLHNAGLNMQRTDQLANTKAVSATAVDQNRAAVATLKATVAADQAAIETAKLQLSYCFIEAPISGRAGVLLVNEGNVVKNNDTVLAIINQIQPAYVDFAVPEQHLAPLREIMARHPLSVEVSLPGQPGRHAEGTLKMINNQVDRTTGTILLRAEFANTDELLWPGQYVNATLTSGVESNVVVVPPEAIQLSQQGRYAIVVKPDQTVEFRPVEVGEALAQETVVTKGLAPEDRVVTSGQLRLTPGARVQLKTAEASTGSAQPRTSGKSP